MLDQARIYLRKMKVALEQDDDIAFLHTCAIMAAGMLAAGDEMAAYMSEEDWEKLTTWGKDDNEGLVAIARMILVDMRGDHA
jgi:hypothetical protein